MCPNATVMLQTVNVLECSDKDVEHDMYHFLNANQSCYEVSVQVKGTPLNMEIDTGVAVTIVPQRVYDSDFSYFKCVPAKHSFRTYYTGEQLQLKGQCGVAAAYKRQA